MGSLMSLSSSPGGALLRAADAAAPAGSSSRPAYGSSRSAWARHFLPVHAFDGFGAALVKWGRAPVGFGEVPGHGREMARRPWSGIGLANS
jgi:hypothetical protein